ncbi:unnamed protein product [Medioppia subpectinata]|uniref:Protein kinase domain-containing protein n=1 Tax=Medioppia subpectinata TaxID=1979941 RepID=A0A7R9Q489_9ACAR|nr:unnamed protein product [Medioppia subpectinata]CAG2111348.1 unnamed protein product [Medioppia subpectinata]
MESKTSQHPSGLSGDHNDKIDKNFYADHFELLEKIGQGAFGIVYRVKHKFDQEVYAIKIVNFLDNNDSKQHILNEVKHLAKIRSDYVVKYYNTWYGNCNHLYIQMEYCPQTLRTVLADKGLVFGRQSPAEPMNAYEYYISCEIFRELLECVQYLHELKPQIIHRNLTLNNVLISYNTSGNVNNTNPRCFIKLGSFAFAIEHDKHIHDKSNNTHTTNVDTNQYMAPEVKRINYNHKSDIYSLALIGAEIFDLELDYRFKLNDYPKNHALNKHVMFLHRMLQSMMSYPVCNDRPECRQVRLVIIWDTFSEESKQKVLKEVKSLSKMDTNFVVKYYNSWLEFNHLYIQMDFCPQSLTSLLKDKPIVFGRQPKDPINSVFEYFISCEIFKELLECVQYLHESSPQVIHRDLKPDNILIDTNINSNWFIKLCDFGLATDNNTDGQTVDRYKRTAVGTHGYAALEVLSGKQYNHKSDVYSLHAIGEELFGFDFQS